MSYQYTKVGDYYVVNIDEGCSHCKLCDEYIDLDYQLMEIHIIRHMIEEKMGWK